MPPLLQGPDGRLDIEALMLQAAAGAQAGPAETGSGRSDYLSAISAEGSRTVIAVEAPSRGAGDSDEPAPVPASLPARASETPEGRIEVVDGRRFVVVEAGDTLGRLATEFYGDFFEFRKIYVANRDVIANPNLLRPGTRLLLP